jgi:membrane protease YdiL (CAAX protease family)
MKKLIDLLKKYPLLNAFVAVFFSMITIKTLKTDTYVEMLVVRILLCATMFFLLSLISGDKTLNKCGNSTGYVIKVSLILWILALPLGILAFLGTIATEEISPDWPYHLFTCFLLFIFVGLFEELAFRAIINDAMLYQFRDKKNVFVWIAIVSCFAFGAAHVFGTVLLTPLDYIQAAGKTLSSAAFGLFTLILYWHTRNIWACGIVHGVYDFILACGNSFTGKPFSPTYVVADEYAIWLVGVYAVMILVMLIPLGVLWKKVGKKIDFEQIRREW